MSLLSSKNVIYGFQVLREGEHGEALIDTNELAKELISQQEKEYKAKLLAEERERRLEAMRESGAEIPEGMDPDEFLGLADTITGSEEPEEPDVDYVAEAMAEAERILAEANEKAEDILSTAQRDADAMRTIAKSDGQREGHQEGLQKAAEELQEAKKEMDEKISSIEEEYRQKTIELEHNLVEMMLPVFEKVFNAQLSGKKDIIYHLLDRCILNIARSKQMQIRVNDANVEFIRSKKGDILNRVGEDVNLDIVTDSLLNDSQCIVETDGGVFDCSIDTELDELIRSIRSLS